MDYDQQRMAQAQQWTNNIQTSDAGALIYIPMPQSMQYPTTAYDTSANAYDDNNNNNNYIAQRNHLFANRPAKKSLLQRNLATQSIPSSSLQYSSYPQSPLTVDMHYPHQQQQQQHYNQYTQVAYQPANPAAPATNAQFSNAQTSVDESLLHGEMPLPQDQTYIVTNAALNIPTNVEHDYLT